MSHIAKFNLKLEDERRLRTALQGLGCNITEGYLTDYYGKKTTSYDRKPIVFGFTTKGGRKTNQFGFTRDADGALCLVGDADGTGLGQTVVQQAIENSYVNEGVNEVAPVLEALGFVEQPTENTVQLNMIGG